MPPKRKAPRKVLKPKRVSERFRKITKPAKRRIPKPVFVIPEEKTPIPLIPISSLRRDSCELKFDDYKRGGMIAMGFFGKVYELCDSKKQCPYVLKVQTFAKNKDMTIEDFAREIAFQRYVYDKLKLAPKIYDAWICKSDDPSMGVDDIGFVIMERMDGTLTDYLQSENVPVKQIKQMLEVNLIKLHKLGVEHGDITTDNIFYKRSGTGVQLFFGDFGMAHEHGGLHPKNASDDDHRLRRIFQIMGY